MRRLISLIKCKLLNRHKYAVYAAYPGDSQNYKYMECVYCGKNILEITRKNKVEVPT